MINRWIRFGFYLLCFVTVIHINSVVAEDKMRGPFVHPSKRYKPTYYETSTAKLVGKGAINLYSKYISPADGPRSPSYPTSTAYGKEAVERHGFLIGVVLIADRLIHEADVHLGPKITLYGNQRYFDPPEANTYWWDEQ